MALSGNPLIDVCVKRLCGLAKSSACVTNVALFLNIVLWHLLLYTVCLSATHRLPS